MTITLTEAMKGFPNFLYNTHKSESTCKSYIKDLDYFDKYLKIHLKNKIRYLNKLTTIEIYGYLDYLMHFVRDGIFKVATADRKFTALKTFLKYLSACYGLSNLANEITWHSYISSKSDYLEDEDSFRLVLEDMHIQQLFSTIKNSTDKNRYRDFLIFYMLYSFGCRRSVILRIKYHHINLYRNEIKLYHSKSKKGTVVKIPLDLAKYIAEYLKVHPCSGPTDYLIKGRNFHRLSTSAYSNAIKKWIDASGIQQYYPLPITGHAFRHTFVTNALRNNYSLKKIMKYTGHKCSKSIDAYEHLIPDDLADISVMHTVSISMF